MWGGSPSFRHAKRLFPRRWDATRPASTHFSSNPFHIPFFLFCLAGKPPGKNVGTRKAGRSLAKYFGLSSFAGFLVSQANSSPEATASPPSFSADQDVATTVTPLLPRGPRRGKKKWTIASISIVVILILGGLWLGLYNFQQPQGSLSLQITPASPDPIDLTAVGKIDWIHWGRDCSYQSPAGLVDRKNSKQVINMKIDVADESQAKHPYSCFHGALPVVSWSDGTPESLGIDDRFLGDTDLQSGFTFFIPASTAFQTFCIFVGGDGAWGQVAAHLSDSSATDKKQRQIFGLAAQQSVSGFSTITIRFRTASTGQLLTIAFTKTGDTVGPHDSIDVVAAWLF